MTVSTTTSRVTYTGDGSSTSFPVPFPFFGADELEVIERVIATGVETTKTLTTDYAVAGGAGTTGTVTAVSAPAATVEWTIRRITAQTQLVDYTPNDPFPAETHEQALDRACMRDQELTEQVGRALTIPVSDPSSIVTELPSSVDRASQFFAFDANGNPTTAAGTSADLTPVSSFMNGLLGAADAQSARDTLVAAGKPGSSTARKIALWTDANGNLKNGPALGTAGDVLTSNGAGSDPSFQAPGTGSFRNLAVNGGFLVWQRGSAVAAAPSNNAYGGADRWRCLGEDAAGAGTFTIKLDESNLPGTGARYVAKLTTANANEKFGILQVLDSKSCVGFRGKAVSLSFQGLVSNARLAGANMGLALLSWNGTANGTGSSPISAWNVEGPAVGGAPLPTLAANWSFVGGAGMPWNASAGVWTSVSLEGLTVPADCKNLAVLIWCNDKSYTAGDYAMVADVQLEVASAATAFERRSFDDELRRCQHFYCKTFPYATAPAQNAGVTGALVAASYANTAGFPALTWQFPVAMRGTPTVTTYNPSAANSSWRNTTLAADVAAADPAASTTADNVLLTTSAGVGAGNNILRIHADANAEL